MTIDGAAFLITGGASGLGAAAATHLVDQGASVVLADVNTEDGEAHAKALGQQAIFVETDVTEAAQVQQAIDLGHKTFGGLNGALSCAGVVLARRTLSKHGAHDLESFSRVVQINLMGTFNVARLMAPLLAENEPNDEGERGVLVNVASIAAFDGQIGQAAYAASKGGIVSMTLPLARDLAQNGIRVMAVAPGIFDTPMMASLPDDARESLGQQVPFPSRLGHPAEFAQLARAIITNPMLNGEVIRLDGAIRMGPR